MEEKQIIKCSDCKHCEGIRPFGNSRKEFFCKHPDESYISDYYKIHDIKKLEGFLNFGKPWSDEVPLKTSPAWCPKKKPSN